jgi:hypothetical protein
MKNAIKKACVWLLFPVFLAVMALPLLRFNFREGAVSVVDNKTLASAPRLTLADGAYNPEWTAEAASYLEDRIGWKDDATLFNMAARYALFRTFEHPIYLLAPDEEVFYTSSNGRLIDAWQGADPVEEEELADCTENVEAMARYYEDRGVAYLMATIPDKENVYPELYPPSIRRFSEKTRFDQLIDYVRAHTSLTALNLKDALTAAKANERVYYRMLDPSHWNMNGAFVGYQAITQAIARKVSGVRILQKEDFRVVEEPYWGPVEALGQSPLIRAAMSMRDARYRYEPLYTPGATKYPGTPGGMEIPQGYDYRGYVNPALPDAPKLLIYGDSYLLLFALPFFAESFSEVHFVRYGASRDVVEALEENVGPDVVLFCMVEHMYAGDHFDFLPYARAEGEMDNSLADMLQ